MQRFILSALVGMVLSVYGATLTVCAFEMIPAIQVEDDRGFW